MTEREKLRKLLISNVTVLQTAGVSATSTLRLVDHLIANGVTIPVHCRDCKHYKPQNQSVRWNHTTPYCMRSKVSIKVKPDDFCSYGEREDNARETD